MPQDPHSAQRIAELEAQLAESRRAVEKSEETLQAAATMLFEAEEMIDYSLKRAEMAEEFAEHSQRELEETTSQLTRAQEQVERAVQRADSLAAESQDTNELRAQSDLMKQKLLATRNELQGARSTVLRFKQAAEEAEGRVDFVEIKLREAEQRARELAGEDAIASSLQRGVFDKFMLSGALEVAVRQAKRHRRRVALLNLRLVKVEESEALEPLIVRRLAKVVRHSDLFAQTGLCVFALMIEEQNPGENARRIAESLASRAASAFKQPLLFEGDRYFADLAIGIGVYPADGDTALDLWHSAEGALSEAMEAQSPGLHYHKNSPYRD